jgi:hypothetical protein
MPNSKFDFKSKIENLIAAIKSVLLFCRNSTIFGLSSKWEKFREAFENLAICLAENSKLILIGIPVEIPT